ncbi:Uncharacterized protein XB15_01440 [Leptospira santarosai]|nr:Uncharacterized protein XB15_01440 [Leptospira santarosai]
MANSALDATQMFQSIARHTNITDASQGQSGAVIHIFRDQKVSNAISPNLNDRSVSSSLTSIINAGGFNTGGTIVGHSAGGRTIQNGIMNAGKLSTINADVITFGGANNTSFNDKVKTWTDIMHRQDLVTGPVWGSKAYDASIGNYQMIRTNFQNVNDKDWKTHSFLGTYNEEFLQYYKNNRGN